MNYEGLAEAVSAAAGSAVVVGESARRFWRRREERQEAAFHRAVQVIVDSAISHVLARQTEFEHRQGQHLDRQDKRLARIEDKLS